MEDYKTMNKEVINLHNGTKSYFRSQSVHIHNKSNNNSNNSNNSNTGIIALYQANPSEVNPTGSNY